MVRVRSRESLEAPLKGVWASGVFFAQTLPLHTRLGSPRGCITWMVEMPLFKKRVLDGAVSPSMPFHRARLGQEELGRSFQLARPSLQQVAHLRQHWCSTEDCLLLERALGRFILFVCAVVGDIKPLSCGRESMFDSEWKASAWHFSSGPV